jgi:predicted Zn-dependent peptidase
MLLGDIDHKTVIQQLESNLGSWRVAPGQPKVPPSVPTDRAPQSAGHKVYLGDQPGLKQAIVMLVEPGIQQTDPDVCALDVLGGIMNGLGGAHPGLGPRCLPPNFRIKHLDQ